MRDKERDQEFRGLRDHYNPPPEPPREEMWDAIEARLEAGSGEVISLEEVRERKRIRFSPPLRWAAAAAAVLVLGVGIGRMTAPGTAPVAVASFAPDPTVMRAAAVDHLIRTESLLTLARADARAGRVEPGMAAWSRTLLAQTRLLMDAGTGADPQMTELLEDLELVLIQIQGVANASDGDPARVRSEWNLALNGLRESDVLPRIKAVIPARAGFNGT